MQRVETRAEVANEATQASFDQALLYAHEYWSILAAQAGDNTAYEELFKTHQPSVYYQVVNLAKNHHDAEDITQETFLNGLRFINSFEPRGVSIRAWFGRIASNLFYTSIRKHKREGLWVPIEEEDFATTTTLPSYILDANDFVADVNRRLDTARYLEAVTADATGINSAFIDALKAMYIDDLTTEQASNRLGIPAATYRTRVHRAKKALSEFGRPAEY